MPEPILAVIGILLCWIAAVLSNWMREDSPFVAPLGIILSGCGGLYFTVRLVHWAWETPIPFGK